jgi:hypothetical protein
MSERKVEENMIEYIKTLQQIEEDQEPFKQMKRDLKQTFIDAGRLTRDEISMTVKAYRLLKNGEDMEKLIDTYSRLAGHVQPDE